METRRTHRRLLVSIILTSVALFVSGGVRAVRQSDDDFPPPVKLGKMAPAFTVTTLDGKQHSLAEFRGKVVLINFWATWCPPSREGLPEIQSLAKTYGDKGLAVLTISAEPVKTISPFLKSNHYTFPAYRDTGKVKATYKVGIIPTVAVIDKEGHLVAYMPGLPEPTAIKAALKKAGMTLN